MGEKKIRRGLGKVAGEVVGTVSALPVVGRVTEGVIDNLLLARTYDAKNEDGENVKMKKTIFGTDKPK